MTAATDWQAIRGLAFLQRRFTPLCCSQADFSHLVKGRTTWAEIYWEHSSLLHMLMHEKRPKVAVLYWNYDVFYQRPPLVQQQLCDYHWASVLMWPSRPSDYKRKISDRNMFVEYDSWVVFTTYLTRFNRFSGKSVLFSSNPVAWLWVCWLTEKWGWKTVWWQPCDLSPERHYVIESFYTLWLQYFNTKIDVQWQHVFLSKSSQTKGWEVIIRSLQRKTYFKQFFPVSSIQFQG